MDKKKIEPIVLPDVHDPSVPIAGLLPRQPANNTNKGQVQPRESEAAEKEDKNDDVDIGGGD